MVCSDDEAQDSDPYYGIDYSKGPKGFGFARGVGDDMGDCAKSREDEDVDFWVAEKSEEVLK